MNSNKHERTVPVVIPHFRAPDALQQTILAARSQIGVNVEIFVRDNSEDNILFTRAVNEGLRKYCFRDDIEFVVVLNHDATLHPDCLANVIEEMQARPEVGIGCPIQLGADGAPTWFGSLQAFPYGVHDNHAVNPLPSPFNTYWANGACMVLRTAMVREIGLLDENMLFICSDSDYSFTARSRGWDILVVPTAQVDHALGRSSQSGYSWLDAIKLYDVRYFTSKWLSKDLYARLAYEGTDLQPAAVESELMRINDLLRHFLIDTSMPTVPNARSHKSSFADEPMDQTALQHALNLHAQGHFVQACQAYNQLLLQRPENPELLQLLGSVQCQSGQVRTGILNIQRSLEIQPKQPAVWSNLGMVFLQNDRLQDSLSCFQKSISQQPDTRTYNCLGHVQRMLGFGAEAVHSFKQAAQLSPKDFDTHNNLGVVLRELGQSSEALAHLQAALEVIPGNPMALANMGNALLDLGRLDESIDCLRQSVSAQPGANSCNSLANALHRQGIHEEALSVYLQAISLAPESAMICNNIGVLLRDMLRSKDAVEYLLKATQLSPQYAEAFNNLGNVYKDLYLLDNAVACYERTIALNPGDMQARNNLALTKVDQGLSDEALAIIDAAIAIDPHYADSWIHKSMLSLQMGRLEEGFAGYESRWMKPGTYTSRDLPEPIWTGQESLAGKTILIYPEQGLGDFIQFIRYAQLLVDLGAHVVIEAPGPLLTVTQTLKGSFTFISSGQTPPPYDFRCPVMSLPRAFHTGLGNIPAATPYLFPSTSQSKAWKKKLGPKTKQRVGLIWSGNPKHGNDHNRSVPCALLSPLLQTDCEFHCLQKEVRTSDLDVLKTLPLVHLHQDELNDFSDTAALIDQMDLVISVDTSVAHLAGALGKPLWVLLPRIPDWRWMLDRRDSPWYPSATLYRQPALGDWESVMLEMAENITQ